MRDQSLVAPHLRYTLTDWISMVIVFLAAMVGYLYTMSPTVAFWDAGEFLAAAYSLGIPHPPGTPLYVLVGKFFSLIPFPGIETVTKRINFMSVFFGAAAIAWLYLIIVRLIKGWQTDLSNILDRLIVYFAAATGSLVAAYSFSYWNNSVEAEVYSIAMFIMAFTTWLAFEWYDRFGEVGNNNRLLLIVYLLSLGVGNHLLCFLVAPGIFLLVAFKDIRVALDLVVMGIFVFLLINLTLLSVGLSHEMYPIGLILLAVVLAGGMIVYMWPHPNLKFIIAGTILFMLGLIVHAYLPIRSFHNPMIDEGNPENWQAFMDVLLRKQYGGQSVVERRADFGFQIALWWKYFSWQFGGKVLSFSLFILLGIYGMVWHAMRKTSTFLVFLVHFVITSLGLVIYLNLSDAEVRERDYFFVAGYYFFGVWISIGIVGIVELIRESMAKSITAGRQVGVAIATVALLLIAIPVSSNYHDVNRAGNYVPHDYGYNILASVDPEGLIFTNGDNDTFPLWYVQLVQEFRKDVTVMNLSLLNTPWYIKQLRDNPPGNLKGIIQWTDREIENLQPFILDRDRTINVAYMRIELKQNQIITVKDQAVWHIIDNNWDRQTRSWKKPIFFAVTVADIDAFRPWLSLEGLVFRIVQERGDYQVTVDQTIENLEEKYLFRGLFDDSITLDDNTRKLISNYAAAYSRLAFQMHDEAMTLASSDSAAAYDKREEAIKWMKKAVHFAPETGTGALIWRSLGAMQDENGHTQDAIESLEKSIAISDDTNFKIQSLQLLSRIQYEQGRYEDAIAYIDRALILAPDNQRLRTIRQLYNQEQAMQQAAPESAAPAPTEPDSAANE